MRRPIVRALSLAATAVALFFFAGCKGEWVEDERTIGYVGDARRDPFLACKRLLDRWGYEVEQGIGITELPDYYGTIVLASDAVTNYGTTAKLERWVEDGGHLIYCMGGTDRVTGAEDDSGIFTELEYDAEDDDLVLRRFGLERNYFNELDESDATSNVRFESGEELEVAVGGYQGVDALESLPDDSLKDRESGPFKVLSISREGGRISVLADGGLLRNDEIGNHDHARFMVNLMELGSGSEVWFITDPDRSILLWLFKHAGMAMWVLILLIVFWVWKNGPRFGPVSEGEGVGLGAVARERFADHLSTGGRFLWRRKCSGTLLEPMRRSIVRTYQQKSPDANPGKMIDWIAARSGIPAVRVQRCLDEQMITDGAAMVAVVRDLQTIEEKL